MTGQLITTYDGSSTNANGTIEPNSRFTGNIGSFRKPYEYGNFARLWLGGSGNSGEAYARMGLINLFTGKADNFATIYPYENGNSASYILPSTGGTIATTDSVTGICCKKIVNAGAFTSIRAALVSSAVPQGLTTWNCQNASDNPWSTGIVATALLFKHTDSGAYSYVWVVTASGLYTTSTGASVPSSLTWTRKIQ